MIVVCVLRFLFVCLDLGLYPYMTFKSFSSDVIHCQVLISFSIFYCNSGLAMLFFSSSRFSFRLSEVLITPKPLVHSFMQPGLNFAHDVIFCS